MHPPGPGAGAEESDAGSRGRSGHGASVARSTDNAVRRAYRRGRRAAEGASSRPHTPSGNTIQGNRGLAAAKSKGNPMSD
ncbi:hypothetical protein T261_5948 [Streptomyces lydicus]|nr:hypothetical protein T261_5948 [Streptomyces lydicus]